MSYIDIAMGTLPGVLYPAASSKTFVAQEQEVVVRPENQVVPVAEQEEAAALLSILLEVEALAEVEIW